MANPATDRAQAIANLGAAYRPRDPTAPERVLTLMLTEGMSATRALAAVGCSWASLGEWRAGRGAPADWRERYESARDTLSDSHADAVIETTLEGEAAILGLDDAKKASAIAAMYRERAQGHRWRAAVQAPKRWSEKGQEQQAATSVTVVVALPALQGLGTVAATAVTAATPQLRATAGEYVDAEIETLPLSQGGSAGGG